MALTLTYLGACDAAWNGQSLAFATNTARALLAYLASHANQPQTREHLAALFHPDQPQATALVNLRSTLARVRKAIPEASAALTVTPHAILFRRGAAQVDVAAFESLLAECAAHAHTHSSAAMSAATHASANRTACPDCIARLRRAADLYCGEFLLGLSLGRSQPFEEWLLFKREQLQREMLELLSTLACHAEAQADYERMAEHARRAIKIDFLHEEAYAQLMRALAMTGQRAAALAQFEGWVSILREALGVSPSLELIELRARIDAGDLAASAQAVDNPTVAQTLPSPLTPFFGREDELAEIVAQLRIPNPDTRLLTLTGLGGMGKTRLAIEVAQVCVGLNVFPDGVFFVSLAALTQPSEIAAAIAATLNLPPSSNDPLSGLRAMLRTKRALLVLDNLEHLLGDAEQRCAALLVTLLEAAPGLRILATSRERLNIRGERVVEMQGMILMGETLAEMSSAPAVRLFVQHVRLSQSSFKLTEDNAPHIVRICRLVHGMPLGLELAAAWAGTLSIADIAAEIERSTDFLAYDWAEAPPRQRSMRAVFDSSWQLLSDTERQVLQRLAVFRGGFTRQAAEVVAGASWHGLTRLMRKSLVRQSTPGRYDMHELVGQFAAEKLNASNIQCEGDEAWTRHSTWHLGQAAACAIRLARNEPRQASAELMADLDNLRQAWDWAVAQADVPLLRRAAYGLFQLYYLRCYLSEGGHMFAASASMCMTAIDGNDAAIGLASVCYAIQARFVNTQLNFAEGLALAERAVEVGVRCGDCAGQALGHMRMGQSLSRLGRSGDALPHFEQALMMARAVHDATPGDALILQDVEWEAMLWCAVSATDQSGVQTAISICLEALALCRTRGALQGELRCLLDLIGYTMDAADDDRAAAYVRQAQTLTQDLGNPYPLATLSMMRGHVHMNRDEFALAQAAFEHELSLADGMSDSVILSALDATLELGHLWVKLGDYALARSHLDRFTHVGNASHVAFYQLIWNMHMTRLMLRMGDVAVSVLHARAAVALAVESGSPAEEAQASWLLGYALETEMQPSEAVVHYERASALSKAQPRAYSAVEPLAGLARIALVRGDVEQAMAHVEDIMPYLSSKPCTGLDELFLVYLTCVQVLQAARDRRGEDVIRTAYARLNAYAERIGDADLRRSYLKGVAGHGELEAIWQHTQMTVSPTTPLIAQEA